MPTSNVVSGFERFEFFLGDLDGFWVQLILLAIILEATTIGGINTLLALVVTGLCKTH